MACGVWPRASRRCVRREPETATYPTYLTHPTYRTCPTCATDPTYLTHPTVPNPSPESRGPPFPST
jgi:hypothetical protein